jgi:hypothetical protein
MPSKTVRLIVDASEIQAQQDEITKLLESLKPLDDSINNIVTELVSRFLHLPENFTVGSDPRPTTGTGDYIFKVALPGWYFELFTTTISAFKGLLNLAHDRPQLFIDNYQKTITQGNANEN